MADMVPPLIREVGRGEFRLAEPLLELLLLPLAFHVLGLIAALAIPFDLVRVYALAGTGMVALHIVAAVFVGGGGLKDLAVLAAAPFYVLWKVALLPVLLRTARKDTEWIRTDRQSSEGGEP